MALWRAPFDKDEVGRFHRKNNMLQGWWKLSIPFIYNQIHLAGDRCSEDLRHSYFYFKNAQQFEGFIEKSEYDVTKCTHAQSLGYGDSIRKIPINPSASVPVSAPESSSRGREGGPDAVAVAENVNGNALHESRKGLEEKENEGASPRDNKEDDYAIQATLGVLAFYIVLVSEKKIQPSLEKLSYFMKVFVFVINGIGPIIRGTYTYNPFTSAGCVIGKDWRGATDGGNYTEPGVSAWRASPELCNSNVYYGFSVAQIVLVAFVVSLNLSMTLGVIMCAAVTLRRKSLMLKETGLLIERTSVLAQGQKSTFITLPPALLLSEGTNASCWNSLRKILLDFGINYQRRQNTSIGILVISMILMLLAVILINIDRQSSVYVFSSAGSLHISVVAFTALFGISFSLGIMLIEGDTANKQTNVHLNALSSQRVALLNEIALKLETMNIDSTGMDVQRVLMGLHSIESVSDSLTHQDRLYPISILGIRADKKLLITILSVGISLCGLVVRLLY